MEPQSGTRTWQWVVTIIVIIALVVIGILVFGNKDTSDTGSTDGSSMTNETGNAAEVNRIVMSDQYPGNVVYLSSVQLANGGWVEIHKDEGGVPGAIIGSTYFDKGINPGKITLSQPTVEGGIYYAMIHADDGDKVFNAAKDLPIKDSRGNIIMKLFRASSAVGAGLKG